MHACRGRCSPSVPDSSENDRTWGGIGAGGSHNWNDDKYSLYSEVSFNTSLSNFADSYSLNGTAGLRVKF
jgi:fibronectin-binding autotransporter adhesin